MYLDQRAIGPVVPDNPAVVGFVYMSLICHIEISFTSEKTLIYLDKNAILMRKLVQFLH